VSKSQAKVLFTGASGLLGANALLEWSGRFKLAGVFHSHPIWHFRDLRPGLELLQVDLRDRDATRNAVLAFRPEYIVHAAALTNIELCERDEALAQAVNVESTRILAEAAGEIGAKLLYVSTDSFFDGKEGSRDKFKEMDLATPRSVYSRTKLEAEEVTLNADPRNLVVRTNLYGWNAQTKLSFGEWILQKAARGEEIPLFEDVYYSPILVQDLLDAMAILLESGASGKYHVAGADGISKLNFGQRLLKQFGLSDRGIRPSSVASLPTYRSRNMMLSVEKFSRQFPQVSLGVDDGIKRFHQLFQSGVPSTLKAQPVESLAKLTD
jgi:dTDP-4-dehydrorhamnose reductase